MAEDPSTLNIMESSPPKRRPNRSAKERREQMRRSDLRLICKLAAGMASMETHRGCALSKIGACLQREVQQHMAQRPQRHHDGHSAQRKWMPLCKQHQRGKCTFGGMCKFSHDTDSSYGHRDNINDNVNDNDNEEAAKAEADERHAKAEARRIAKAEADRLEAEKAEAAQVETERAAKAKADRLEAERIAQAEADRFEAERAEAARVEAERAAKAEADERPAKAEAERIAQAEADRLEVEKADTARVEAMRAAKVEADERHAIAEAATAAKERQPRTLRCWSKPVEDSGDEVELVLNQRLCQAEEMHHGHTHRLLSRKQPVSSGDRRRRQPKPKMKPIGS